MDICDTFKIVVKFKELISFPFILDWKDKSRIHLYALDLCGIIAIGDNLKLSGYDCLIFSNVVLQMYPPLSFS